MARSAPLPTPLQVGGTLAGQVLVSLGGLLARAAVGAARTAVRLSAIGARHEAIEASARKVEEVSARMRADIDGAAKAAAGTAEASQRVADITRAGREVSSQSLESMRRLLEHSDRTNERLGGLLGKVREVTGVSRLIDEIATRTKLLALNASIEATRAGAAGRTFAVVASEVRDLARNTAEKTQKIDELVRSILGDLEPARAAMEESRALAKHTAERVEAVDQQLATVNELAEKTSGHVGEIARALADESGSVATLATATQSVVQSITELREEVRHISNEAFAVGNVVDEGFHQLARVDIDSPFHRRLALCRELSTRSGDILTRAVASGRCTLDQALALEYREIVGAEVRGLARLFDVSKVPASGFTPPKYHTGYDKIVDVDMQRVCDDVLARDEKLLFALPIDLNSYGPIHNRRFMKDWTGDPAKDLAGNRIKRFFTDNRVLVRGARVGLGTAALELPDRVMRADFQRVSSLVATPAQREEFMVQTYVRDTGALVTVVTAPIFVQGQRWGAGLIGWTEEA